MRSGAKLLTAAVAIALVVTGCDSGTSEPAATPPNATSVATTTAVGSQEPALLTELVPLALEDSTRNLGVWLANPSGTAVVYELPNEVWAVDRTGVPWLVASAGGVSRMEFLGEDAIAITGQENGTNQITHALLDGSASTVVAESARELRYISSVADELVYAEAGVDTVALYAWSLDTAEIREMGSYEQEFPDLSGLAKVGGHIVFEASDGNSATLSAISLSDGSIVEVPQHDSEFHSRLVGEAPTGDAVLTEGRRGGGYIYTVDLDRPEEMTNLSRNAVAPMVRLEGTVVEFVNTNDRLRQIDLVTGEISDRPQETSEPPGPVDGLEAENIKLRAMLDNGNWLVSGYLSDGAKYRAVWKFTEQFGGGESEGDVPVLALFEYNPTTKDLWQISGPPTLAATQTASGSGVGPSGLLRVELLDGFIVFSTGFRGAAYDIEYNLYASPIPSAVDD